MSNDDGTESDTESEYFAPGATKRRRTDEAQMTTETTEDAESNTVYITPVDVGTVVEWIYASVCREDEDGAVLTAREYLRGGVNRKDGFVVAMETKMQEVKKVLTKADKLLTELYEELRQKWIKDGYEGLLSKKIPTAIGRKQVLIRNAQRDLHEKMRQERAPLDEQRFKLERMHIAYQLLGKIYNRFCKSQF